MHRKETIEKKLSVLNPHLIQITDQTADHFGHPGNPHGNSESHFLISIAAEELDDLPTIKQHRIIQNLLIDEFNKGLHALSIEVRHTKNNK